MRWIELFEGAAGQAVASFYREFHKISDGAVWVDLGVSRKRPDTLVLHSIGTTTRGAGYGAKAMSLLCDIADRASLAIELEVGPQEDREDEEADGEPLDFRDLVDWYHRSGFDWTGNGPVMRREPNPK